MIEFIIISLVLLIALCFDARRDVYMSSDSLTWVKRHIDKYIACTPVVLYFYIKLLLLSHFNLYVLILVPIASFIVWRISLYITGARWESNFTLLFKYLKRKLTKKNGDN